MQALLRDAEMSILRHKDRRTQESLPHELEVYPNDPSADEDYMTAAELDAQEFDTESRSTRRSPAALFGSQRIGSVVVPLELQNTISRLIAESDKPMLHVDAKRLFLNETDDRAKWDTAYETHYKSKLQNARHAERDGTAFASVALPAHYSAIYSVLDHLKQRLGPEWFIERVIDWGAGTGSGLWATSHSFQKLLAPGVEDTDTQLSNSTLASYVGIERRLGLTTIGKRLVEGTALGNVNVTWQKAFHEENKLSRGEGRNVLALSAFMLSSLPTPAARKQMVKQIWESGAEMMVLIDHNSTAGFECIAEAREWLLRWGKRDIEDPETENAPIHGSHVVAPCPHDHACPLFRPGSSRTVCGFSQRLQRPDFVRKTKHAKGGHEDIGYSYVVIRRGARPPHPESKVGRLGEVGRWEQQKAAEALLPTTELAIHRDGDSLDHQALENSPADLEAPSSDLTTLELSPHDIETSLRSEAYYWPRLVFPPLKRSGHIILDGCTSEGKVMRMTIPRSQGKQPYYDARKSGWGDIFPHDPKNPPQERFQPEDVNKPIKNQHIGKRSKAPQRVSEYNYSKLAESLNEKRRLMKRENKLSREHHEHYGQE